MCKKKAAGMGALISNTHVAQSSESCRVEPDQVSAERLHTCSARGRVLTSENRTAWPNAWPQLTFQPCFRRPFSPHFPFTNFPHDCMFTFDASFLGFYIATLDPRALGITTARVQPYMTAYTLYKSVYILESSCQ